MSERIAAFFDVDGTLIQEPSLEWRFVASLRRNGVIPYSNYLRWMVEAVQLLPNGLLAAQHTNKRYLAGLNSDLVLEHLDSLTFFEEGIARVAWHVRQSHPIILVTGTLLPLAQAAASALECELEARGLTVQVHILATRLEESRGCWTGRIEGNALYGPAKAQAAGTLAQRYQWDLSQCHAYGNSILDCDLLRVVGRGHAVNPGKRLAAMANEQDWPIWHWHHEKKIAIDTNGLSGIDSVGGEA